MHYSVCSRSINLVAYTKVYGGCMMMHMAYTISHFRNLHYVARPEMEMPKVRLRVPIICWENYRDCTFQFSFYSIIGLQLLVYTIILPIFLIMVNHIAVLFTCTKRSNFKSVLLVSLYFLYFPNVFPIRYNKKKE